MLDSPVRNSPTSEQRKVQGGQFLAVREDPGVDPPVTLSAQHEALENNSRFIAPHHWFKEDRSAVP
jgi:hypothetical protein